MLRRCVPPASLSSPGKIALPFRCRYLSPLTEGNGGDVVIVAAVDVIDESIERIKVKTCVI